MAASCSSTAPGQPGVQAAGSDLKRGTSSARPLFCRDRVPDFVWEPQAKRMHQIVRIDFENYFFFSASERAHPPQTQPLPTDAEVLGALSFKNPGSAPEQSGQTLEFCYGPLILTIHWCQV